MKQKQPSAFSLIEVLVVLAITMVLMCLSFEMKTDITPNATISTIRTFLHEAQKTAIQTQETIYLSQNMDHVLIQDLYGEVLLAQKFSKRIRFYDLDQNACSQITILPSGFTSRYTMKLYSGQCFTIDPLSLNLYETK